MLQGCLLAGGVAVDVALKQDDMGARRVEGVEEVLCWGVVKARVQACCRNGACHVVAQWCRGRATCEVAALGEK